MHSSNHSMPITKPLPSEHCCHQCRHIQRCEPQHSFRYIRLIPDHCLPSEGPCAEAIVSNTPFMPITARLEMYLSSVATTCALAGKALALVDASGQPTLSVLGPCNIPSPEVPGASSAQSADTQLPQPMDTATLEAPLLQPADTPLPLTESVPDATCTATDDTAANSATTTTAIQQGRHRGRVKASDKYNSDAISLQYVIIRSANCCWHAH